MRKQIVAIACSDLHLSLKPPLARANEPNWLEAQKRTVDQIRDLAEKYEAPILCAGDLFDKWNSPVELVNWAIENLPTMYCIPGQHDLPFHDINSIHKSAYWTLVKALKIIHVKNDGSMINSNWEHSIAPFLIENRNIHLQGFSWGQPLEPPNLIGGKLNIALIHQYLWTEGSSYPGAPEESRLGKTLPGSKGWNVVVFGDNHKGFSTRCKEVSVFNCGGFQRRKSDEIDYSPQVGLIYEDGSVEPFYLNCDEDIIVKTESAKQIKNDMQLTDFLESLTNLKSSNLDFEETMKQVLEEKKPSHEVWKTILEAMETK